MLSRLSCVQGQYNPAAFAALDYIISEAGKRGLRLVLALADNWVWPGCQLQAQSREPWL